MFGCDRLLNSYLLHSHSESRNRRPLTELKLQHPNHDLPENDNVVAAETHEYRDGVIRSPIFKDKKNSIESVSTLDKAQHTLMRYYIGLGVAQEKRVTLIRSVEMV